MSGISICGPGPWRVDPERLCPWCLERRRCLSAPVYGGWCGFDHICGTCGTRWSDDDDRGLRKHTEEEREANIACVAAVADPKCWDCHDTGDTATVFIDPDADTRCSCPAACA